ncbi:MAG: hypothetical protein K0Q72_5479 [Armatimonadetes bacterium]|jgi:hypothetical protein|nr:hypothetical protein [Armatimonadota bacterium]
MTAPHPSILEFGEWLAGEYRADGSLDAVRLLTAPDAAPADLAVRLEVGKKSYYLARVHLDTATLEAGFATLDRTVNEELEQMILDNGGSLDDLLGDELCDLGLEPLPMKHYYERPAFLFAVPLSYEGLDGLASPELRKQVTGVLKACRVLFQPTVDEA